MKHIDTITEPMYYYESEHVVLGKRGDCKAFRDIYLYREDEGKWRRYILKDRFYREFSDDIFRNSRSISAEELKEKGIPPIENNLPDITTQILEEARKAKDQESKS